MDAKPIYIVCTPYFPTPESWRGPFCYDFVRALLRTGKYDVWVFKPERGEDYEYNGIRVYRFQGRSTICGFFPYLVAGANRRLFMEKAARVGVDWRRVAVFHAHEGYLLPLTAAIKAANPAVKIACHFHSMGHPFHVRGSRLGLLPVLSTLVYCYNRNRREQVEYPVYVSERQRSMMGRWYPNGFLNPPEDLRLKLWFGRWCRTIRMRPSYVLYNGIDRSVFNPTGRVPHDGQFVIGDVANFGDSKDQITLIRAIERLRGEIPGLKCRLVGSGPELVRCHDYVADANLGDIVEFIPEMDHLQLPDFYRSLDLFVSPSWAEGFCCTFMEAVGCGTPIMGCMGVSVDEAIMPDEHHLWLFAPQNVDELVKKILYFYRNRPKQHLTQDFDIDRLVPRFLDWLNRGEV